MAKKNDGKKRDSSLCILILRTTSVKGKRTRTRTHKRGGVMLWVGELGGVRVRNVHGMLHDIGWQRQRSLAKGEGGVAFSGM